MLLAAKNTTANHSRSGQRVAPGVKAGEAIWDFMMERQSRPRPRTRFSANTSGRMCLMLEALTWVKGGPGWDGRGEGAPGRVRGKGGRWQEGR